MYPAKLRRRLKNGVRKTAGVRLIRCRAQKKTQGIFSILEVNRGISPFATGGLDAVKSLIIEKESRFLIKRRIRDVLAGICRLVVTKRRAFRAA
jgi:hypothetical protein